MTPAQQVALLREGREFALANTRAAAVRHRLSEWGDRVEDALKDADAAPRPDPFRALLAEVVSDFHDYIAQTVAGDDWVKRARAALRGEQP